MAEIKLNIGHKGKNYVMGFENILEGKKIGDKVPGDFFGLDGYELEITGGSDNAGFPMKKSVDGVGRKKPLRVGGGRKGMKIRKTVVGNTIGSHTAQVNLKVVKEGSKKLDEVFKKEEVKEEKPVEEKEPKKEEKPKEEKPQEAKEEKK